jgi:hypothetical protein
MPQTMPRAFSYATSALLLVSCLGIGPGARALADEPAEDTTSFHDLRQLIEEQATDPRAPA